jgi:hypothetical protein
MKRRLERMERKNPKADVLLTFPDASTRAVVVGDPLGVLCSAMRRISAVIGPPEGREGDVSECKHEKRFDKAIDLLGAASGIETENCFVELVGEACQQAVELERNKPNADKAAESGER